jgi:hypothetical protein
MNTQLLETAKKPITVSDYDLLNRYRKNLELYLESNRKQLTTVKVQNLASEINRIRKHLNMKNY